MRRSGKGERIPDLAWVTRHVCKSATPFVERALSRRDARRNLPHVIAETAAREFLEELGYDAGMADGLFDRFEPRGFDADQAGPRLRLVADRFEDRDTIFSFILTRYGLPVFGGEVRITLVGPTPSLVEGSLNLPSGLECAEMEAPRGRYLPRLVDRGMLVQVLGLRGPVDLVSKRLVIHRAEPDNIGYAGRIITALGQPGPSPVSNRMPLSRDAREGHFDFATEVQFDYAPPGLCKGRWRVLMDCRSGAVRHAERVARDALDPSWQAERHVSADRVPASLARAAEARGTGADDWVGILKRAANNAAMTSRVFRS